MKTKQCVIGCLLLLFCTNAAILTAQQATSIKVGKDTDVARFFNESRWLLPSFENATLFLKQSKTNANINYDLLTENLFFIDAKNDTLELQNIKDVVIVQIDKRLFQFYNNLFVEIVHHSDNSEIWLRRQIRKTDSRKTGAYGLPSATSSVTNINSINVGGQFKDLDVVEWAKYEPSLTFYLSKGNKVRVANKSGFLKFYAKKKKEIETYLKEQPVNFENLEDITRLENFCDSL